MLGRKTFPKLFRLSKKSFGLISINISKSFLVFGAPSWRRVGPASVVIPVGLSVNLGSVAMKNVNRAKCGYNIIINYPVKTKHTINTFLDRSILYLRKTRSIHRPDLLPASIVRVVLEKIDFHFTCTVSSIIYKPTTKIIKITKT